MTQVAIGPSDSRCRSGKVRGRSSANHVAYPICVDVCCKGGDVATHLIPTPKKRTQIHRFVFRSGGQHPNHPNTATWRPSCATYLHPFSFFLFFFLSSHLALIFLLQPNSIRSKKKKHAGKIASLGCLPPPIKHTLFHRGQTKFRVHLLFTTLSKWLIHCV